MEGKSNQPRIAVSAELDQGARLRLERDWRLTMSERLARVHHLSKQITSIAGAAKRR
jgi:hypothetical protein